MANTIIDSLFLELGIDVSKFSKDQQRALTKIQQFESQTKRAAGNASGQIKTVGQAFRDLAKESRIGSSAVQVENLAAKFKMLGTSMKAGGAAEGLGGMAMGLGALLSPATLGRIAIGLLAKEAWDLNKVMTANNATMDRQAQLSGMNAKNMWSWGEAARTVGANPQDVTGNITALQTAVTGMGIGAGDATAQLVSLARLGIGFDFKKGVDIQKAVDIVHRKAKASGFQNLGALRALTMPWMGDALWNIATNPSYDPSQLEKQIKASAPANLNAILQNSLKSQSVLGELGIQKDILAETAYGSEQGLMQAVVQILTSLLGVVNKIANFLTSPEKIVSAAKSVWGDAVEAGHLIKDLVMPPAIRGKMSRGMQTLMDMGVSKDDAASLIGNLAQESSLNPLARNGSHVGLGQWDKTRQADFAKRYGYQMGSEAAPEYKQFLDQIQFARDELLSTHRAAANAMAKARDLMGKTKAFMDLDEAPGDNSLAKRFGFAQQAARLAEMSGMVQARSVQHTVTSETHIGEINVHTPSTDPKAHANAVGDGLANHPLLNPAGQSTVSLATRGMTG